MAFLGGYKARTGTWTVTLRGAHTENQYVYKIDGTTVRSKAGAEMLAYRKHGELYRDDTSTVNEMAWYFVLGESTWDPS